jgi:hypothetical protein
LEIQAKHFRIIVFNEGRLRAIRNELHDLQFCEHDLSASRVLPIGSKYSKNPKKAPQFFDPAVSPDILDFSARVLATDCVELQNGPMGLTISRYVSVLVQRLCTSITVALSSMPLHADR